ncbi:hypothetical protein PpBr36_01057 [Pyricularia pennisetigena]|uniref:hypothetical protein n=1 Tax=Pyricularia pennisetigena TaxID=1578925 RepID=UPI0011511CC4|nr:hypothetical protein PpBr36_01057 [Pyricularia pennisetigena]TLS29784.1 hypothetical protein PpBr36_01057 [Pyricularia pennisetigena]
MDLGLPGHRRVHVISDGLNGMFQITPLLHPEPLQSIVRLKILYNSEDTLRQRLSAVFNRSLDCVIVDIPEWTPKNREMVTAALSWEAGFKLEGVLADQKPIGGARNLGELQVPRALMRQVQLKQLCQAGHGENPWGGVQR